MALALCPPLKLQVWTTDIATGVLIPLVGGKVYTYITGTTTPLTTYVDADQNAANTNPIILDSRGEASCFLLPQVYDFWVYDSNNNFIESQFKVQGSGSGSGTITSYVGTIAELKLLTPVNNSITFTSGYYTASDTCNGEWYYDPTSAAVADDVFVVSPASLPTLGRYIRLFSGQVASVKFAGILGNGTTQNYNILISAISTTYPNGIELQWPDGSYLVDSDLEFPLSDLNLDEGASFAVAADRTLTISKGFKKDRSTAFTGTGAVVMVNAKIDSLYPEWFGLPTDATAFTRACASNYPGDYSFEASTAYTLAGSYSCPGNSISGNNAIITLTNNLNISLGGLTTIRKLHIQGNTAWTVYLSGGNVLIDQIWVRGLAASHAGALNLAFSQSDVRCPEVWASGANTGSGALFCDGGSNTITSPLLTNESGNVPYAFVFDNSSKNIIVSYISNSSFLIDDYLVLNSSKYALYSLDARVDGNITITGNISAPTADVTFNNGTFNGSITASTDITAGLGANGRIYGTTVNNRFAPGGQLFVNLSPSPGTTSGTAETVMGTTVIPATTMATNNDRMTVHLQGSFDTEACVNRRVRVSLNGDSNTAFDFTITPDASEGAGVSLTMWKCDLDIWRSASTTAYCSGILSSNLTQTGFTYIYPNGGAYRVFLGSLNWTTSMNLKVWGTATTSGSVGLDLISIDYFPNP